VPRNGSLGRSGFVALEFHIITSQEFFRLGAHGEVDWSKSLEVLSILVKNFQDRGTNLALLDVRDTETDLTDEQVESFVNVLKKNGLREEHRVAILHRIRPNPKARVFVEAALDRGFDFGEFTSYEIAVEWLSQSDEEDPDFDRETYYGPDGQASSDQRPQEPS
jgi:hypothetical protein